MKKCFVVCPLGKDGSDIRKLSNQVFKYIIEPVCNEKKYEATRCDKIHDVDKIDQTILNYLESSDLVIADLSGGNPNAFFELGYRSALKKPLIHIAKENEPLPFDVAGIRTIFYELTDLDKVDKCKKQLSQTIDAIFADTNVDVNDKEQRAHPVTETAKPIFINTQILTHLLEIKDMLSDLKATTNQNNDKVVGQIIAAFTNQLQTTSTPQDRFTEYALKEFLNNPDKMLNAMKKFPNGKLPTQF